MCSLVAFGRVAMQLTGSVPRCHTRPRFWCRSDSGMFTDQSVKLHVKRWRGWLHGSETLPWGRQDLMFICEAAYFDISEQYVVWLVETGCGFLSSEFPGVFCTCLGWRVMHLMICFVSVCFFYPAESWTGCSDLGVGCLAWDRYALCSE